MKCPYCAEDIKDQAIVCLHCHRDLTLFKPFDKRLQAIESELVALNECVTKMSSFLDRQQTNEVSDTNDKDGPSTRKTKPTFWRKLVIAIVQVSISVTLIFALSALMADLRPDFPSPSAYRDGGWEAAFKQYKDESEARTRPVLKILYGALFALPIGLGLWCGLRWRGRNLKRYLAAGLICGLLDGLIIVTIIVGAIIVDGYYSRGLISNALFVVAIDTLRCVFGFATGGLIGDWIERRRHPQLYGKGFTELLAAARRKRARGLDRLTLGFGRVATSIAPLIPLMGVLITSSVGFYSAKQAAKVALDKKGQEAKSSSSPTPTPQLSPQP